VKQLEVFPVTDNRSRDETTLRIITLLGAIVARAAVFLVALWLVSLTGLLHHIDHRWVLALTWIVVAAIVIRQGYREHQRGRGDAPEG